ncbi:dephospho-CoA kinase [Labrys okinawensis]|uniref:Dephospho-CoA kinase n=1 Tax=Labrys okinawensis TaxID=346911 RepID=A0A2S9QGV4_9HYPH|nr:dephospho-CoA kinase [Labrys okinawensis]PRH88587.1 dephospho-CoA kinase [Labrys okinawensis]
MTFILGLTGSIGMGKSATAAMFRARGIPVHDADATVHRLYAGPAVAAVEAAFPGVSVDGVIDRAKLGRQVFGNAEAMRTLETIVHPLVHAAEQEFLAAARAKGANLAVLDIPLLYETGGERRCRAVAVVSAPARIQRERVMARPGMDEERFAVILARQVPDVEKRRRAHFIIDSSKGLDFAQSQVDAIIAALSSTA